MIIVQIIPDAGLGNQMFMYAAGLSTAHRLNTELKLGAWHFNIYSRPDRTYQLSCFQAITETNATFSDMLKVCPRIAFLMLIKGKRPIKKKHIFRRILRKILLKSVPSKGRYGAVWGSYSPDFESIPDNTYICGYWESERIFADIKDIIRTKFIFAPECFNPELSERINSCNAVAIHVRRGDKVTGDLFICSQEDYIRQAIAKMNSLTENPEYFVFSDDIEYCRKVLPQIYDTHYTFIDGQSPAQDMALMTLCKHTIVAPSTFSWWGAWLNKNPDKIIIAPDVNLWYKSGTYDPEDRKYLLPDNWIKIG